MTFFSATRYSGKPASMDKNQMQFFDENGRPLSDGRLYIHKHGVAATPDIFNLDRAGCARIVLPAGTYKITLSNAQGTTKHIFENITGAPS